MHLFCSHHSHLLGFGKNTRRHAAVTSESCTTNFISNNDDNKLAIQRKQQQAESSNITRATKTKTTIMSSHHPGITCDECGMNPIVGTRYKATHLYDYDICVDCLQDHVTFKEQQQQDTTSTTTATRMTSSLPTSLFVAFPHPVDWNVSRHICQVSDNSLRATSLQEAAEKIGRNDPNCTTAHLTIFVVPRNNNEEEVEEQGQEQQSTIMDRGSETITTGATTTSSSTTTSSASSSSSLTCCHPITTALINNTQLKQLHIHICWETSDCTTSIIALAKGIEKNTSLQRVFWHIGKESRNPKTAIAIRNMIVTNSTLDALYIGRDCYGQHELLRSNRNRRRRILRNRRRNSRATRTRSNGDNNNNNNNNDIVAVVEEDDEEDDEDDDDEIEISDNFASTIFEGLAYNQTLRILRLAGYQILSSDTTLEHLLEILYHSSSSQQHQYQPNNQTIGKVYADFDFFHEFDYHDETTTTTTTDRKKLDYDSRLDLLLTCNRESWMKHFTNTDATRHELFTILLQALQYNNPSNDNSNLLGNTTLMTTTTTPPPKTTSHQPVLDPVATAYHLLRSRPDFVSGCVGGGAVGDGTSISKSK